MIHKYGATICFHGWDNITWCPWLNVMLVCPNGDVFIGSIDTIGEWKDAHSICNTSSGYIKTIGIDDIVQICTNNVLSMRSATDLLIHCFPSLYFQGYVAHCLQLLLGKNCMGKINCEKNENCCFFHTTTLCTTNNLSSLWDQLNATKPHWNTVCN